MSRQLWKVVGGEDKGGIVVRSGQATSSPLEPSRLSTGALVEELLLVEDRLHYRRITGTGPEEGWISIVLSTGKPLVQRAPDGAAVVLQHLSEPLLGRKPRVLAIHGAPANGPFMKFQTAPLRTAMGGGKIAEWIFLDGIFPWEPMDIEAPPQQQTYTRERTEWEKRIGVGKPFVVWIPMLHRDGNFSDDLEAAVKSVDHIRAYIEEHGPIDIIVTFSQSAGLILAIMKQYMADGVAIPWRLNVFMNPPILMTRLEEPSPFPTISVRGRADPWAFASAEIPKSLSNVLELEHEDGHEFPVTNPSAASVYERVGYEMRKACGLLEPALGP